MAIKREIKFRAWHKGQSEIIPFEKIEYLDLLDSQINIRHTWDEDEAIEETLTLPLGDFELMQYTGRKDKNGVEIYEDDIIIDQDGRYAVVFWQLDDCQFLVDFQADLEVEQISINYIVCGNAWENVQLLK